MCKTRDIEDYTKLYLKDEYEKYQVIYRRKKVLEILNKYQPESVLEIGCGTDSIFNYYTNLAFGGA